MFKNIKIYYVACLCLTVAGFHYHLAAQNRSIGVPLIQHFSPEDYDAGILNYKLTQDQRGYILVANNKGVLEYDGTNWRTHEVTGNSRVRTIFVDEEGQIFVGTQNEIGFLWPNNYGHYSYQSLKHLLPTEHADFDDIWQIYETSRGVVFSSTEGLFVYDGKTVEFIAFERLNILSFTFNNHIYNQVMDVGLLVLEEDEWVLSEQGSFFSDKEVRAMSTYSEQSNLISTYEHGIFLVEKHQVLAWAAPFAAIFATHKIIVCKRLQDGTFAIGTNTDGLYILNENGALINHFTKGSGLTSKTVLDIFEDSFGNIWVGQNNGLSKIEWNSPFRFVNEHIELSGTGYTMLATDSTVYFGTNNGLYAYKWRQNTFSNKLEKIQGVEGQVYSIKEINGDIIVGCNIGAYQITNNQVTEISSGVGWWTFIETDNPKLMIAGGYAGLFLLEKINAKWTVQKYYSGFNESSRVLEFDNDGALWMSHGYKGIYKFNFSNDYDTMLNIEFFNEDDGLPSNFGTNVFKVNGELIFTTIDGVYQFDNSSHSFKAYAKYRDKIGEHKVIRYLIEDHQGDIFYISSDSSGTLQKTNWGYERGNNQLNKVHSLFNDDLENISILKNDHIVFASRDGFIIYDKSYTSRFSNDFHVAIRQVLLTNTDSIIFDGNFLTDSSIVPNQNSNNYQELAISDNSIHINYSAIEYDEIAPKYRYRLYGYEDKWSKWSEITEKEYTNLFEGNYSFDVQAISALGAISPITSYKFKIFPPWYRTGWMKLIYLILIVGSAFWIIYFSRKNRKIITKQGEELINQDLHLKRVSEKTSHEINQLKNEKLVDDIRHKKSQLASTTMHLIDRNDFINSIQKSLNEMIAESETLKVRPKLRRIVSDIERNKTEKQDWSQFELLFNEVNDDFTKKIKANFPKITSLEARLCIYLRMNLSTKEIANLSHVTPRAIEMSRYRLRKKLNLAKEDSLSDFLTQF